MKLFKMIFSSVFGAVGLVFLAVGLAVRSVPDADAPVLAPIFCLSGGIFLLVAMITLLLLSDRRRKRLLDTGIRVTATVTDIRPNYGVKLNQRSPYRVYAQCEHPLTRETVTLHSHDLFHLTVATGQTVEIAFDPMHEKRYAFDLSEEAQP